MNWVTVALAVALSLAASAVFCLLLCRAVLKETREQRTWLRGIEARVGLLEEQVVWLEDREGKVRR